MFVKTLVIALVVAVGANEVEDEVNRYVLHIHPLLPANLNLTSGELKLFAGHALNMIHAKCPAVNAEKIFQAQKYIGKLIAKAGPVIGSSEVFKKVLQSVTECTKEGVIVSEGESHPQGSGFFDSILAPFHQVRTFWIQRVTPSEPQGDSEESTTPEDDTYQEYERSGLVPQAEEQPLEPSQTNEEHISIFTPPQSPRPAAPPTSIFSWIRGIFQRMGSVFHGMFSYPLSRKRRQAVDESEFPEDSDFGDAPISTHDGETLAMRVVKGDAQDEFYTQPQQPEPEETEESDNDEPGVAIPIFLGESTVGSRNPGKAAFARLIDHMCELYCSTCSHPTEMVNFKKAAKQLLIFLFSDEDNSALELGANKFLDQDFLNSITECERGHK